MPAVLYKRQRELLEFIQNFIARNGYSPTLQELCRGMKVSSVATIHEHLKTLEKKGVIKRNAGEIRGIEIAAPYNVNFIPTGELSQVELPLLGYVQAGQPLEPYIDPTATFKVSANLVPSGKMSYVLQVKGESMIEDGILPGDFVVLVKEEHVKDGDIVVALLRNGLATLKKFFREDGQFKLMPANSKMEPIYTTELQIQGKLVALVRRYT